MDFFAKKTPRDIQIMADTGTARVTFHTIEDAARFSLQIAIRFQYCYRPMTSLDQLSCLYWVVKFSLGISFIIHRARSSQIVMILFHLLV